jgi:ATP-dependent DNA ligase
MAKLEVDQLVDPARLEIKLGSYSESNATALVDIAWHARAQDYRRQAAARMYPLSKSDISKRVAKSKYHVSKKIDGQFALLIYKDGQVATVNPGGTVRTGLPWQVEAAKLIKATGVSHALIAGEVYLIGEEPNQRTRVHDVTRALRQPEDEAHLARIQFAVFDILLADDQSYDTIEAVAPLLDKWFAKGEKIHAVTSCWLESDQEIAAQFEKWVEDDDGEGIVTRSDTAGTYKIKPQHSVDTVVIGFTESSDERQGMLHDLLLGVVRPDNTLHVLCRVGGGFSDDERRDLLSDLKDMVIESEYAEVNSDHVAYRMVRPEWVAEITCLDLVSQTTRGGPINRMVLLWDENASIFRTVRRLPLASVIAPQFVRLRQDKQPVAADVPIRQIADIVEVAQADVDARQLQLPTSEVLSRNVYKKILKGATMVRKFIAWKTNKETESDEFAAYVMHYTDYSSNRKDPLKREVRISNSLEQIEELCEQMIEGNIKKGWNEVEAE